jgi:tight adherence protein B
MVDELARAARTGRSLEHCFAMVADDTPAPLGDELRTSSRKMQMGANISEAVRDLPTRTGVVSLSVFATALSVHHQTGGDLIHVLERLASTIRDRLTFLGRLKTATTASRATALLMIILPPAILAFFMFRDPTYFDSLMSSSWGRNVTLFAIFLQIVGSIWIVRILRNSQRN